MPRSNSAHPCRTPTRAREPALCTGCPPFARGGGRALQSLHPAAVEAAQAARRPPGLRVPRSASLPVLPVERAVERAVERGAVERVVRSSVVPLSVVPLSLMPLSKVPAVVPSSTTPLPWHKPC